MSDELTASPDHHYHFVTGRLAEAAVRHVVEELADEHGFAYSIGVMPITVAALITPKWLLRHLEVPAEATHVIVPGYLREGLDELRKRLEIPVFSGPNDCRELPHWFGGRRREVQLDQHDIEIIAEINHATRLTRGQLVDEAKKLAEQGADRIDIGCDPSQRSGHVGELVAAVVAEGLRVSIDTFDPWEAEQAIAHGASLVLSVNSSNREAARDWDAEVVAIPDTPSDRKSLDETIGYLVGHGVAFRIDPILEPIGLGLAASLVRYAEARRDYPDAEMMMGIGNLTELSDVDSAGVNLLLLGLCGELRIRSVLTTQVINWSRSSVRECDVGRRLVHYATRHGVPPKRLSDQLVMLRDPQLRPFPPEALAALAESIKDNNYRLFAQDEGIHLIAGGLHLVDDDPFRLFESLLRQPQADNVDVGHAFYLGFEMAKASIALTLGKQYEQDRALRWGLLTREEDHHRLARTSRHRRGGPDRS